MGHFWPVLFSIQYPATINEQQNSTDWRAHSETYLQWWADGKVNYLELEAPWLCNSILVYWLSGDGPPL